MNKLGFDKDQKAQKKALEGTHVNIGPCKVPHYPINSWDKIPDEIHMEEVWKLVGPQVDKHIQIHPLWKVFCVVYIEALQHGMEISNKPEKKI